MLCAFRVKEPRSYPEAGVKQRRQLTPLRLRVSVLHIRLCGVTNNAGVYGLQFAHKPTWRLALPGQPSPLVTSTL